MCVRDVIYKVFWFIVIYQVKNDFKIKKKAFKKRKRKMKFIMVYGEKAGREEKKTIL